MSGYFLILYLSNVNISTHALLWLPFPWNTYFHNFSSILCVSSNLKWVSHTQDIVGFFFLIHVAKLCLLIGGISFKMVTRRERLSIMLKLFPGTFYCTFVPLFLTCCLPMCFFDDDDDDDFWLVTCFLISFLSVCYRYIFCGYHRVT